MPEDDAVATGSSSAGASASTESSTLEPTTGAASTDGGDSTVGTTTASGSGELDTDGEASTGALDGRVLEGLIALYVFDEGTGVIVSDGSAVDPPLDLELEGEGFTWTRTGLHTEGSGIAIAHGSPAKIREACQATDELTLEAWITPDYAVIPLEAQPGRILTYSSSSLDRNFTLGQGTAAMFGMQTGEGFGARLRTSDPGTNNGDPGLQAEVTIALQPQHIVFTRRENGYETLYRDAQPIGTQDVKIGSLSTWDTASSYRFAVGNELDLTRPFIGEIHLVAIYDRALTASEVAQNYEAGFAAR